MDRRKKTNYKEPEEITLEVAEFHKKRNKDYRELLLLVDNFETDITQHLAVSVAFDTSDLIKRLLLAVTSFETELEVLCYLRGVDI